MKKTDRKTIMTGIGGILCIIGLAAWAYQLLGKGMVITDLRNIFSWGLYMGSFEFFIALSSGGMLLFSICYIWKVASLKPYTRVASIASFASVIAAGVAIMEDLGYPLHSVHMLLHPNLYSPLMWDVAVLGIYAILTLIAMLLQLVPGAKRFRDRRNVRLDCELYSAKLSYFALPFVVILNLVTSLMFATQNTREWWHSALIPVNAVAEAFAVGLAFMLLLAAILSPKGGMQVWGEGLRRIARYTGWAILAYLIFTAVEMVTLAWNHSAETRELLHLVTGTYGLLFWLQILLPLAAMIGFFAVRRPGRKAYGILSVFVMIGIFIQRMMLLLPAFNAVPMTLQINGAESSLWTYPVALGLFEPGEKVFATFWNYTPTPLEWCAAMLPVGIVILAIALGVKFFPLIPHTWEKQIIEEEK